MKKLLFVAFIALTGIVHAKDDSAKKTFKTKKEIRKNAKQGKAQKCYQYGMAAWCRPNEIITDTVCYDTEVPGSYEHSKDCTRENGQLYNIFMCGKNDYGGSNSINY